MTDVIAPGPRPSIVVVVPPRTRPSVTVPTTGTGNVEVPPAAPDSGDVVVEPNPTPDVPVVTENTPPVHVEFQRGPQGHPGPPGPPGPPGTSVTILGSLPDAESLPFPGNLGDAYMIDGDLYVWSNTSENWVNVGSIEGPPGPGVADMRWEGPELIVTLENGTVINAGYIEGLDGNGWLTQAQVEGVATSVLVEHVESSLPHPVYDDLPSLKLLFENQLGGI